MLLESKMPPLGTEAYDFSLPGTDGNIYSLSTFSDKKVLVIIFMCNHCPYVKAVLDRFIAIQNRYADSSVQLVGINPNDPVNYPEDSMESMKKLVKKKNVSFVYLRDDTQEVSRKYDAVCTPDIYLYGQERKLLYRGRMDDNWQDESAIRSEDLKNAIDAVLHDKPVATEQVPSMGCSIKWK